MNNEQVKRAVDKYSQAVGYKDDGSRKAKQVQFRSAMINALHLTHKISDEQIAQHLNLTRTTSLFHRRRHEENLKYWDGYESLFETAKRCVLEVAPDVRSKSRDEVCAIHLTRLNELKDYLYRGNNFKHAKYLAEAIDFIVASTEELKKTDNISKILVNHD